MNPRGTKPSETVFETRRLRLNQAEAWPKGCRGEPASAARADPGLSLVAPERADYAVAIDPYTCTGGEALQRLGDNPAARWSSGWGVEPEPGTAWYRITKEAFFRPQVRPEFTIGQEDSLFAIGSCFARRVEQAASRLGCPVESLSETFDGFELRMLSGRLSFVNKYTALSILNELRWALEPGGGFPSEALQELPDATWVDPHVHRVFGAVERDVALELHRRLTELTSRVARCRVVVVTLGLIETFFDTWTGLFTNEAPDLTVEPERFRFRVLSYEEVVQALEEIHDLLRRHGHPGLEIVVTVSPVALEATFTGEDVVLANTLSKSVLRAAAGWWASAYENVHYFPSYEMVMNTRPEFARRIDGTHVPDEMVEEVMRAFLDLHVNGALVTVGGSSGASLQ